MSEEHPTYQITPPPVVVVADSWEIRLLEKARQMRREVAGTKNEALLRFTADGPVFAGVLQPRGRISS